MRILVVTSCTSEKAVEHERHLTLEDFRQGSDHLAARERELVDLMLPAEELYTGQSHVRLMRGVRAIREANDDRLTVDVYIVSAGYGLVAGSQKLAPYQATFQGMKKKELRTWADSLGVPAAVRQVLAEPYDLALVLLGDPYLEASALDDQVTLGGPTLIFCGSRALKRLPDFKGLKPVALTNKEAKRFSCGLVALKGEMGARVLSKIAADSAGVGTLTEDSADVLTLLERAEPSGKTGRRQARANPAVDYVIQVPESWWDKPHRKQLRYFIPEWDDLVDPDYDFETDTHSGGSGDWSNEVYAHQLYPEPNYDGILVSKVVAEKSKKKKERINALGVHRYLRVPREFPIMGDCGAFGYIKEDVPPYTANEILEYYTRLGFDYGVSVDHLIVTATESQKKERYQLTIQNAEDFITEHRKRGLTWEPVGAVQGWDPASYAEAARQYVAMGYRYIGLGGLVRSSTPRIMEVLQTVHTVLPPDVQAHLFGLARLNAIPSFAEFGIRSIDSASYLRQAWMRDSQGYLTEASSFAAIRVPEIGRSFRAKRMLAASGISLAAAQELESEALRTLRELDASSCTMDDCLDAVLKYDGLFRSPREFLRTSYAQTLSEMPWKTCACEICQRDGVDVIMFRGNNRNRRRGFHNTYVFYRLVQRILSGEDVLLGGEDPDDAPTQLSLLTPVPT